MYFIGQYCSAESIVYCSSYGISTYYSLFTRIDMLSQISRKKFIVLGSIFLGLAGFLKLRIFNIQGREKKSKYLTQDGKLVEVDEQHITSRKKIYTSEIQHWISKH